MTVGKMVQRLNSEQVRQIFQDLIPLGIARQRVPEPVDPEFVALTCASLVSGPTGRGYGLFDNQLQPRGVLIGLIMPDLLTGQMTGIEHIWWTAPKADGMSLLRAFEADCKAAQCKHMQCGYLEFSRPDHMKKLYSRLGYKSHSTTVFKEL